MLTGKGFAPIPSPPSLREMDRLHPEKLWALQGKYEEDLGKWCEGVPDTIGFLRTDFLQVISPAFEKDLREQGKRDEGPLNKWRISYFFRRNPEDPWEASGHSLFASKKDAVKECRFCRGEIVF